MLLGLNPWEAEACCRVLMSMLMGSIIGFERRRADRPAGIRTMAMVCLGACVFTIDSMFAFVDGTMGWDASRVSAAIPSGVGFLGAASIWKGTQPKGGADGEVHAPEVHGLTTATSVWFSAAVGILAGGALYGPGFFTTFAGVVYLRFAPRLYEGASDETQGSSEDGEIKPSSSNDELNQPLNPNGTGGAGGNPVPMNLPGPPPRRDSRTAEHGDVPSPALGQVRPERKDSNTAFRRPAEIHA